MKTSSFIEPIEAAFCAHPPSPDVLADTLTHRNRGRGKRTGNSWSGGFSGSVTLNGDDVGKCAGGVLSGGIVTTYAKLFFADDYAAAARAVVEDFRLDLALLKSIPGAAKPPAPASSRSTATSLPRRPMTTAQSFPIESRRGKSIRPRQVNGCTSTKTAKPLCS